MKHIFFIFLVTTLLPLASRAGEKIVRLNVEPMVAPKPALKYLLLPEVRELKPGNPVQYYMRCFAEQSNLFFNKGVAADRARYRTMPLDKLATGKLQYYVHNSAVRQVDWAARLNAVDWEMTERVQSEGMDLTLPELGPFHILAEVLQLRFRIDVAAGRFDDAVRDAKTMFAFARHLGEHSVESANLFGLSVAELAVDTLEEMLQQPGCPNLYWAFTDLPCPLVDLRKGLQGSCTQAAAELRPLRDDAMTAEELEKVVSRLSGVMAYAREQAGQSPRGLRAALKARLADPQKVNDARARLFAERRAVLLRRIRGEETARAFAERLFEMSYAKGQIQKLSPLQVVLLSAKRAYEIRRDERMKLLALSPWQIDKRGGAKRGGGEEGLFADLLPHVVADRRAQAHLQQRLALLRCVEALRLYAAEHEGKLPGKLSELSLPLPLDPFAGQAIAYTKEGAVAHLRGRSSRGNENNPTYPIHYEVVVRRASAR